MKGLVKPISWTILTLATTTPFQRELYETLVFTEHWCKSTMYLELILD